MWVKLSCAWGGGGGQTGRGILAMVPYSGTGNSVPSRTFDTSINVSEKAQMNLSESNHPIGNTRSMTIMTPSYYGTDGTTYANAPSWDSTRVPRLYVSVMPSFDTRMGPSQRSASHIDWRIQGEALPNCIDSRATSLSVVSLN